MLATCPHCGSNASSLLRKLIGRATYFRCGACGGLYELNPDLPRASLGLVFFAAALLLALSTGGAEIYRQTPWLLWAVILTAAAVIGYVLFALRHPLRKIGDDHAP